MHYLHHSATAFAAIVAGVIASTHAQAGSRVGGATSVVHDRDAPEVDARHHARRGKPWHEAGAHQRRLAGAARPIHQEKRATLLGRVLEPVDGLGDIAAATEKYRCVLGAEGGKSAEWRPLDLCRPGEGAAMKYWP